MPKYLCTLSVVIFISLLFSPAAAFADESVTWTNIVGASASAGTLTKTNATGWNSGASSVQVIRDGFGYVEFSINDANKEFQLGLSYGDTNQDWSDTDFGIDIDGAGNYRVYEGTTYRGTFGAYAVGDRFRIEVRYGSVRFLRNGTVFYSSPTAPRFPLLVDAAMYTASVSIGDVRIGNLTWGNVVGAKISGESLAKTGTAGWNSGAASANTIESGDGYVEFTATETNTDRAAGLGTGDTDQSLTDIEFGVVLRSDGIVEVSESGTSRGTFGGYLSGDRFRVEVSSGTVRYYRNGSVFYTSTVTPVYPLRADTSLNTVDATLTDLWFDAIVGSSGTGVSLQDATITKTASGGSWNAGVSSTNVISADDGWVEFTARETNTNRVLGLKATGAAQTYADIDFAIDLTDTGVVHIYELGTSRGQFGSYAAGDRLRIEIADGIAQYRKNGTVIYTSSAAPSYPLHVETSFYTNGATISDVVTGTLVWINDGGVQIRGNSLMKTGTTTSWNTAGAVSTRFITSGYVEFTASEANVDRILGLSHDDTDKNWTDVDYGLYLNPNGTISVYEGGSSSRGNFGSFALGDRMRVELQTNGTVRYLKNGTVFYTSTVAPTLPLRVDTSIYQPGGLLFNVILSGVMGTEQLDPPNLSPAAGQYTSTQTVTMSHWLFGVTIRYTTDGNDPTETSTLYTGSVTVDQTSTVKAKAWKGPYTPSTVRAVTYTMKIPAPTFSVASGTYTATQNVSITSASGTTVRYTTDGTDPTTSSTLYSSAVSVDQSLTLKAKAFRSGWTDSDIQAGTYTLKVVTPTASPAGGSYSTAQTISVSTTTPSSTIRYTTDGTEVTASSTAASGGTVTLDHSATFKVRAYRTGWADSDEFIAAYSITMGTAATPTFSPTAGTFTSIQNVTISTSTANATIRYTTDGTDPNYKSRIYTGPLLIWTTTEIRARAFKADMNQSGAATGLFVIDQGTVDAPRLSPGTGTYSTYRVVTVTTETAGATIHYTINGADPTESDATVVSGGTITVNDSMSLKVKAWKAGMTASNVQRADYHITGSVATGGVQSVALKSDGTVWTWGSNANGQLGSGSSGGNRTSPGQVSGLSDVVAVSTGDRHILAVKRDGTVWAWGSNSNGQLGDGTTTPRNQPVQVSNLGSVIAVAAGQTHSLALKTDGTVWAWGSDSATNYGSTPVQMTLVKGIVSISANEYHSRALKTDGEAIGSLWAWGANTVSSYGGSTLGDGTTSNRTSPVTVAGMIDVIDASGGNDMGVAIRADGSVWTWGRNDLGQLGNGSTAGAVAPVQSTVNLSSLGPAVSVAGGGRFTFVLRKPALGAALASPRDIWSWGSNLYGGLGIGSTNTDLLIHRTLVNTPFIIVAGFGSHAAAIPVDGTVWTWGLNPDGELGDGTTTNRPTPAAISGFTVANNSALLNDPDNDGLPTWYEMEIGTDPFNADTNGDGIPDGVAIASGLSATNADADGDGLTNARERELGTDPFRADTDGDGVNDGADCFPLDASRSQCPASNPSDGTPPTITLTAPSNAVLTGTNP